MEAGVSPFVMERSIVCPEGARAFRNARVESPTGHDGEVMRRRFTGFSGAFAPFARCLVGSYR